MKASYTVKTFAKKEDIDFSAVSHAKIDTFMWATGGYEPVAYAQLAYVPGDAFYLRVAAKEDAPLARYTGKSVPVCTDSALEFFVRFDNTSLRYLNIETNANGAVLAELGTSRYDREDISDLFDATAAREGDEWCVYSKVTVEQIEKLFGISRDILKSGYKFFANFYKCGDQTAVPHYGMWNPVKPEKPDYHCPEYFGELVIE